MWIKGAFGILDMFNGGAGEFSTYNGKNKYVAHIDYHSGDLVCSVDQPGTANFKGLAPQKVCPTLAAPFEVFTTVDSKDFDGDYIGKGFGTDDKYHHTANGQMRRTYRHDLDNTTLTYRACDADKAAWAYSRENFVYDQEMFNITEWVPPEERIHELDTTRHVLFPAGLGKFRFFGVDYDKVLMSGHGYIAFGGTVRDDFTESVSEWGKYKMVAALWDDLNPQGGFNPEKRMGIKKHVYAVHQTQKDQLIFQWHFIPETVQDYKVQKSNDENVFRITLDFNTNDIIIKTGIVMSTDGIVGITGGLKANGEQYGHHMVDFSADANSAGACKVPQ
jgi:hypothetical protein